MSWMIREDQLDFNQREFINVESKKEGNIWINGFAGSGKSVLLIHCLTDVLAKDPTAKVVVVVYTWSLIDIFKTGLKEIGIEQDIPVITYYEFTDRTVGNFDYIFCDEVQDLPNKVLIEMKNRSKKLIVSGDSNQSIYDVDPKWRLKSVDPAEIGGIIEAKAYGLDTIHRLTRSIISAVQQLLPVMNIWSSKRDVTKVDVSIRLCKAKDVEEEVTYVFDESQKSAAINETAVILIPRHKDIIDFVQAVLVSKGKQKWNFVGSKWDKNKPLEYQSPDYDDLNRYLKSVDVKMQYVGNGKGSFAGVLKNKDTILMTYHSAKGLDFDNVFIPFLNDQLQIAQSKSDILFMVAMTRSKKNLYLTYSKQLHPFIEVFRKECTEINIDELINPVSSTGVDFDF